uniref:UV excision repair protein RAD23 n=1 Tax=Anopheles atroparvus TaxID=41427 RepID=A0A182IJ42_ANOAO
MKITLKTLKQQTFVVEVDMEKDTVLSLKEKLCAESGQAYPVERQRLIYLGKIMEDEQLLSQYNVDDKKFIVVMNKKPTPAATGDAAGEGTPGSTAASGAASKDQKLGKDAKPEDKPAASSSAAASHSKPSTSSPTASVAGEQQKAKEDTKSSDNTAMGYSEQSARMALEICANYPDRAVEYLLSEMASGNDTEISLGAGLAGGAGQVTAAATTGGGGGGGAGGRDSNPLAFLRSHPVFEDMKRLLQDDPNLLPHLIQRIQTSNPDLMRIIANNQEEFLALINEPQPESQMSQELEDIAAAMVNSLTPSDMDAIDRLKALGYPEHLVIQAYIACERDEYNAAEFLVSQTLDEEE